MGLFRSNSTLIAFDYKNLNNFFYLNLIQNISYEIKTNRIKVKSIGKSTELVDQFSYPEINLNLSYLQEDNFYNEFIFALKYNNDETQNFSIFYDVLKNFYTKNIFILNSENLNFDLKNINYDDSMFVTSIGNVYINDYSVSYKVGDIPVVSVGFLADELKVSKIQKSSNYYFSNWDDSNINLTSNSLNRIKDATSNANSLKYINKITLNQNLTNTYIPSILLKTFSEGIIKSLDISASLNRNKYYFFNKEKKQTDRKIILPINGSLNITGTFTEFNLNEIKNFFNNNAKFNLSLDLYRQSLKSLQINFVDLVVESFSYSINLYQMVEYSLICSFQITETNGLKIIKLNQFDENFLLSSDSKQLLDKNGIYLGYVIE